MSTPRPLSIVIFTGDRKVYSMFTSMFYVFLGEIPNLEGHCVVAEHPHGKILSGFHTENFKEYESDK